MAEEKSTYLLLSTHGEHEPSLALEFLPLDADVDGIWVRTTITASRFQAAFEWFLATFTQRKMASLCGDSAYGKGTLDFDLHDTDCQFTLKFASNSSSDRVEVGVEVQYSWPAGSPAAFLDIKDASAPMPDVKSFMHRISQLG